MSAFSFDPFAESLFQLGRRVTALSFIGLILIGNVWVIYKFTGESAPAWSASGFFFFAFSAAVGGLLMIPRWVKPKIKTDD